MHQFVRKCVKFGTYLVLLSGDTAAKLGFKSIRLVRQMLMKWRSTLEEEEIKILSEFYRGFIKSNEEDPFYNLILSPKMDECEGPFFEKKDVCFGADSFNVKEVYKSCVKVFNRKVLNNRSDTPWRSVLGLSMDCRPEWRALYKPPLPERRGYSMENFAWSNSCQCFYFLGKSRD